MMATFTKRENDWWQARVRRKGNETVSKTFPTKEAAEKWARSIEFRIDRGDYTNRSEAEKTTLADAIDRYLEEVTPNKKSAIQEKNRLLTWKNSKLAKVSLLALTPGNFAKFRDERKKAGVSAATIRLDLAPISHLFNLANKEWGIQVDNPIRKITLPREDNSRDRRLLDGEEVRIVAALKQCKNPWILPAFILACETAMRQGESLDLLWQNVSLKNKTAHLIDTKNGTSRTIPLSPRALETLSELPHSIEGKVLRLTKSALVQSWGHAIKRARVDYEKEMIIAGKTKMEIAVDAMLLDLHWHDLRHEGTSRLAARFMMHELMKVTGHKDSKMVFRYYHPRAEDLAKKLE
jgi:integrase